MAKLPLTKSTKTTQVPYLLTAIVSILPTVLVRKSSPIALSTAIQHLSQRPNVTPFNSSKKPQPKPMPTSATPSSTTSGFTNGTPLSPTAAPSTTKLSAASSLPKSANNHSNFSSFHARVFSPAFHFVYCARIECGPFSVLDFRHDMPVVFCLLCFIVLGDRRFTPSLSALCARTYSYLASLERFFRPSRPAYSRHIE